MQSDEFIRKAKTSIMRDFYENVPDIEEKEVLLIWFCKTIQNWKAIFTTIFSDGKIFEVTYNGDKDEMYIDEYIKNKKKIYRNKDEYYDYLQEKIDITERNYSYDNLWQY